MFSRVKTPESALLPTIKAAMSALQLTGGKIICSLASLPTWGPGKLVVRDKSQAPDGENKLFAIDNLDWKNVATKLTEAGIGIDFFVASPGGTFIDLTTIGKRHILWSRFLSIRIDTVC
jgi:protein transport protein SEC24